MSKIAFVTDSTANIPIEVKDRYKIYEFPQVLIWDGKTYEDGITIQTDEFYQRLKTSKTMPSTSQVSSISMQEMFSSLLDKGFEVLGIFIGGKLSGTVQSAYQGRDSLSKGKDKIEIIDSYTTSLAMAFQIIAAARAAEEGASLAKCKELAEIARAHVGVYFVVDTLEFLHRGGRIGGAQRLLGTALNIKPLLALVDGKVEVVERIRTKSKAIERMIEIVDEQTRGKANIRLGALHANAKDECQVMLDSAEKRMHPVETILNGLSPVVGTHSGPGTLGLAYMDEV